MMQHPDTPVGECTGFKSRHSALTFLAEAIVDRDPNRKRVYLDDHVTYNRTQIFKHLIADPRTPVGHRIDTYNGGEMHDVLDILKKHDTVEGMAYYPIVSRLLWQRQVAIATHYGYRKSIFKAFATANKHLLKDRSFRRLDPKAKEKFLADLDRDLTNQFMRVAYYAHGMADAHGPRKASHSALDARDIRKIMDNLATLPADEVATAKCEVARKIWMDCAHIACVQIPELLSMFGRPEPKLHDIANCIDKVLKPKDKAPQAAL